MAIRNPADLKALAVGRLMGLDIGSKTIGLALSDTRRAIASPLEPSVQPSARIAGVIAALGCPSIATSS